MNSSFWICTSLYFRQSPNYTVSWWRDANQQQYTFKFVLILSKHIDVTHRWREPPSDRVQQHCLMSILIRVKASSNFIVITPGALAQTCLMLNTDPVSASYRHVRQIRAPRKKERKKGLEPSARSLYFHLFPFSDYGRDFWGDDKKFRVFLFLRTSQCALFVAREADRVWINAITIHEGPPRWITLHILILTQWQERTWDECLTLGLSCFR